MITTRSALGLRASVKLTPSSGRGSSQWPGRSTSTKIFNASPLVTGAMSLIVK